VKKVLIIAHLFQASPRILGLAKYLPEFGWQPVILTTPLGDRPSGRFGSPNDFRKNNRVIETYGYSSPYGKKRLASKKYSRVRPFLKFLYKYPREIVRYPDSEKGWKPFAVEAGDELLQNEDVDAIISCSSPVTTHIIASELKIRHKIPWVADFRDLWTQNHNYPYSILRKLFEKKLELKTLSTADALVTGSPLWTEKLKTLHKGKRTYTITNGFDPEKMSDGKTNLTSKFTITHTGQIYTKQDPSKLLAALKDLISERAIESKDVDVRFYGPENGLLAKKIEEYGLSAIVRQCGIVPREISLEKQRESQLLLLLKWEDPQERGVIPGKVFEYLAARRPILATGGTDDVVKELLNETSAGINAQTVEDIKSTLRKLYAEYKLKGKTISQENTEKINKYSYREMAKKFVEVINTIIQH
jgi:glycosyltransferase involved in cell wall biosynthesis